jgi:pimeloyl-ACP methyl ester carboxylesterase
MPVAENVRFCERSGASVSIFYDDMPAPSGDADAEALLYMPGYIGQYHSMDDEFAAMVAARCNLRVIRMESRDAGLSTKMDHQPWALWKIALPECCVGAIPYTLEDMALDAWALLDRLGVRRAHLMGTSMGGMIVQWMAVLRPQATLSIISLFSTPGGPGLPRGSLKSRLAFLQPTRMTNVNEFVEARVQWLRDIGYANNGMMTEVEAEYARRRAAAAYERSSHVGGLARHAAAIMRSPPCDKLLAAACARHHIPVLVVHGDGDNVMPEAHAHRMKQLVPHARVVVLHRFGHSIFPSHYDELVEHLASHVAASREPRARQPTMI